MIEWGAYGPNGSYSHQVLVDCERYSLRYNAPGREVITSVSIDACLVDEIKILWEKGIKTAGCCCGHGEVQGYIHVEDENIQQMKDLGYVQNREHRPDEFKCKTVHI